MDFNYQKAYCVLALPAFESLSDIQKTVHKTMINLVQGLNQGKDLNIPTTKGMKSVLDILSCQELSELSNVSYFVGHWYPGVIKKPFENTCGESWKISNVIDQVLRSRLDIHHNIQIQEGKLRVTFSSKYEWMWEEFGMATEKNLEIFKTCGLSFGSKTLHESAEKLKELCGDLWPDVETLPSNGYYVEFLKKLTEKKLENIKKQHEQKLKKLGKDVENAKIELQAFTWLIDNGIDYDNCIYYNHTEKFSFGWRKSLTEIEKKYFDRKTGWFPFPL